MRLRKEPLLTASALEIAILFLVLLARSLAQTHVISTLSRIMEIETKQIHWSEAPDKPPKHHSLLLDAPAQLLREPQLCPTCATETMKGPRHQLREKVCFLFRVSSHFHPHYPIATPQHLKHR